MTQAGTSSGLGLGLAVVGTVWLAAATLWAMQARAARAPAAVGARAFGWAVIAGMGYALLGLGAAASVPESGGVRAAVVQLSAVILAAILGVVVLSGPRDDEDSGGGQLAVGAVFIAWLTLVGLPPVLGFHGKVLVYKSLLTAGWTWAIVIAMGGSIGILVTFFGVLEACRPRVRGFRAVLTVVLLVALVVLGLYPEPVLMLAEAVRRSVGM